MQVETTLVPRCHRIIRRKDFEKAEALLLNCDENMGQEPTSGTVDILVELYDSWGKPEEAERWREKERALQKVIEEKERR